MCVRPTRSHPIALAGLPLLVAILALASGPAFAHDHQMVGPYEVSVGWTTEPPVVDEINGLYLLIELVVDAQNDTTTPVEGAHLDLSATLIQGTASRVFALQPVSGSPGEYTFSVIPTKPAAYSVRLTGSINGTAVNLTAEIEEPAARDGVGFPDASPSSPELQAQLELSEAAARTLSARVTALEAGGGSSPALAARVTAVEAENADLRAGAATASLFGIVGVISGIAGAGVGAMAMRRKSP